MDVANLIESLTEWPNSLDEAYDLVVTLWRLVQDLGEQLGLNATNSSLPPSQDRLSGKNQERFRRPASAKKRGAQPGQVQNTRGTVPEAQVDQVLRHFPDTRCPCGGALVIDAAPQERHQVFDLPEITYTVTEHQCFAGTCPGRRRQVIAQLPQDVPTGQVGPGLIAWIALMSGHFRLSTWNVQALLHMQQGLKFSTGAISEAQAPVAEWLAPLHEKIGDTLRQAPVAHADETTHFQGAQRHWLWVLCTPQLAIFLVHTSRGMKAARELLGAFAGVLITDRHGAYHAHPMPLRQLCWAAHVIRNLERLSCRKGDPGTLGLWLVRVARIVIRLEHRWRGSGYKSQHHRQRLLAVRANFRTALEQGVAQHARQRTGFACQALLNEEPMLSRFLETPGIDLTNNTAERALRHNVIWRKTSFFTQSERGNLFRARVMTVTESCLRLNLCAYALLRQVCDHGIRKQPITLRLPIDHLYQTDPSRQLPCDRAA